MSDEKSKFTQKQDAFIQLYNGNGTEAARLAGYSGDDNTLAVTAHDLLRNPKIIKAIRERQDAELGPLVASRVKRQEFWSRVMQDVGADMKDRLRASELLGKSEADFAERFEHSGPDGKPIETKSLSDVPDDDLDAKIKALLEKRGCG